MDLINQIKQKINIYELCRIAGLEIVNHKVKSIYKTERTPSLHIYPGGETYHDFSSNKGGDVIDFYMALYNLDKGPAIRDLASLAGIDNSAQPDRQIEPKPQRENISWQDALSNEERFVYEERAALSNESIALKEVRLLRLHRNSVIFESLYEYCQRYQSAEMFNNYLQLNRSIHPEFIKKFKLFYIGNYFEVNNHLKKSFAIDDLRRCGLMNDNGNLIFAKHRIVIPYLSKGQIVYLRARYFDQEFNTDCKGSKYIGLKNDALNVNTAKRLYNLDTINKMYEFERIFITEGEFDAIIAEQMGFNCVAIPGVGNLPEKQLELIVKFNPVICVDNDEAGRMLEDNLTNYFNKRGKDVIVKNLPQKDITDFYRSYVI